MARKNNDQLSPTFKFVSLYASPTYDDFYSLLIHPNSSTDNDEQIHLISPLICRGVCNGGQIVWANTCVLEGLTGRTDPLNTAVGFPMCSIGQDIYILVMFAVDSIPMTPNGVEFLGSMARALCQGSGGGFLPLSRTNEVSPAKTEHFMSAWDKIELLEKYADDISFHLLPIGRLQQFYDYREFTSFHDLFYENKHIHDTAFTMQLNSLKPLTSKRARADSAGSVNSEHWESSNSDITDAASDSDSSPGRSSNEAQEGLRIFSLVFYRSFTIYFPRAVGHFCGS